MGFPRQEYWDGWPFPSPGDLPDSGTEPASPGLAAIFFTAEPSGKPYLVTTLEFKTCILDLLGSTLKFYLYHFQQCMNFTMIQLHWLLLLHLYHYCHIFSVCLRLSTFLPFPVLFLSSFHDSVWDHFLFTVSTPFSNVFFSAGLLHIHSTSVYVNLLLNLSSF